MKKKLVLVFVTAFLLRLIALNQSLWLDEATTAKVISQFNFADIITKFSPGDFHPPLYYLFMKSWSLIFGTSVIALRFPSIIFSLITGWVIFLIGKKLKNEDTGLWAAIFFLFNPLIIYYSQEARMYMMVTLILSILLYVIVRYFGNLSQYQNYSSKFKIYVLLGILILLSFSTFYGSVFFISAILIYLLTKREFKLFFIICTMFTVTCLLLTPLLLQQLTNAKLSLQSVENWSMVLGQVNIKNLALIPLKFATGRVVFYPKITYYAIGGLWTGIIFIIAMKGWLKNKLFLLLFYFPIFLGLVFSYFSPLLQYFRFLYLIPILSLGIALGIRNNYVKAGLMLGFIIWSLLYLLIPGNHREDWQTLARTLPKNQPVYIIESSADAFNYYSKTDIRDLRTISDAVENKITVIPYTSYIHGVDYQSTLVAKGYRLKSKASYRVLILEQWFK